MPNSTHMETAQGEAARLERSGGIQPSSSPTSRRRRCSLPALRANERRPALAQRDDGLIGRRQQAAHSATYSAPVGHLPPSPAMPDSVEIIPHQQRTAQVQRLATTLRPAGCGTGCTPNASL